jgi:flagellar biosynthesis component FlhA
MKSRPNMPLNMKNILNKTKGRPNQIRFIVFFKNKYKILKENLIVKIPNLTLRLIIIFTICMALLVLVLILLQAKKTNVEEYPAEMLLKTSRQGYIYPKPFIINGQRLIISDTINQLKG